MAREKRKRRRELPNIVQALLAVILVPLVLPPFLAVLLFVLLVLNLGRAVRARNISGIVVMGDVHGDVSQDQADKPPEPPKPPFWKEFLTLTNVVLGIAVAVMVIAGFVLG